MCSKTSSSHRALGINFAPSAEAPYHPQIGLARWGAGQSPSQTGSSKGLEGTDRMRIMFASEQAAQSAVKLWEQHGFDATRAGKTVVTDCPTLWAVPLLDRSIGFDQVRRLDVHNRRSAMQHPRGHAAGPITFKRRRTDRT